MNDSQLGGVVRALRHRRGWRQTDVAAKAGVSAGLVALVERGHAERLTLRAVRAIASALDLRLAWDPGYRGAELDRLRDADHAKIAEWVARRLEGLGWVVVAELSFNRYGDRGRIDLVAFHAATRNLLVVEIKTVVVDVQAVLGSLDIKARVAPAAVASIGWRPAHVIPSLVVMESTTNRRRIAEHRHLFGRLALRGKAAVGWLREPSGLPDGVLLLVKLPNRNAVDVRRAGRQRVRQRRRISSGGAGGADPQQAVERA